MPQEKLRSVPCSTTPCTEKTRRVFYQVMDLHHIFSYLFTTLAANEQAVAASPQAVAAPGHDPRGWQVVVVTLLCSGIAQCIKLFSKLIKTGKIDWRIVAKTGGM